MDYFFSDFVALRLTVEKSFVRLKATGADWSVWRLTGYNSIHKFLLSLLYSQKLEVRDFPIQRLQSGEGAVFSKVQLILH